ncbi:P-loop containing nucleoside triphosphate hydrolase protein [Rhodocollybia butyracea]|uniref:P-loop containing nucleoside triphosphate hydrolase protein n=1 Tax=Rhodocollybia butyracea TaxID=206335 RepID=A0A9P5UET0_9AGAR|nr:P-loop containing nucleoside triphosphate hydrolase protein [Rhodocollybia butyracea]
MAYYQDMSRSRYDQGVDSKIVVMGNSGVGKTSLLHRYTQNKFDPKNTTSTSGAFFVTKKVSVQGLKVRLQLWDTAGQERFRSMVSANAALVLYDITNASTFDDVRGWLEELKKNCPPELIIYIVGSKADLHRHRQVTPDFARLSLHNWFPPPRPETPPPPPQPSTLSYIRPRFTSFPGLRSPPASSGLNRSKSAAPTRSRNIPPSSLARSNTTGVQSRFGSHFVTQNGGYNELHDSCSNSIEEEEEDAQQDEQEWGLTKGMELFEVSAKDDFGIHSLFDHLITAIIQRKDVIEKENELKKRDSVFLSSVATPTWSAQAEEEEAREKANNSSNGWSCC